MKAAFAAALLTAGVLALAGCGREPPSRPTAPGQESLPELIAIDLAVGTGEPIAAGQVAVVHYTGWLHAPDAPDQKGRQFDSSRNRGQPFRFTVGGKEVIQGWDEGVVGMRAGGRRRLIVPSHLGYGARGAGRTIPPNATLLFDVELLAIEGTPRAVDPQ